MCDTHIKSYIQLFDLPNNAGKVIVGPLGNVCTIALEELNDLPDRQCLVMNVFMGHAVWSRSGQSCDFSM